MSQDQDNFDFDVDVFQQLQPQKQPLAQAQILSPPQGKVKSSRKQQSSQSHLLSVARQKAKKVSNRFGLTDQQKINLSKRLPKGFVLLKKADFPQNNGPFQGQIQYVPVKKDPKIASQELLEKFPIAVLSTVNPKKDTQKRAQKPGLRLSNGQLPQGKSKQTQKVKGVLQKFRKHPKYPILAQQLNKFGFMQGFAQIQSQIKKNIHTIDSFKDRCLYILNQARLATFTQTTIEVITQLIDQFMFQIQQAKKLQFQNNLIMIQKNIDKITREITEIRESGNWYLRKKKRTEKSFDQKEVMYIADLVRQLPQAYLVGVWEIIQQRPFLESQQKQLQINFSQLKTKKIREIQSYVKRKHNTYFTTRQRKKQKLAKKMQEKQSKSGDYVEKDQIFEVQNKQAKMQEQMNKQEQKQQQKDQFQFKDQLSNFLQVDNKVKQYSDIQIEQNRAENDDRQNVDQFLQLDQIFLPDDRLQMKHNEQFKVPPTPRFNSIDHNHILQIQLKPLQQSYPQKKEQIGSIQQQKEIQQFEMEEPDLRIPQQVDGDSSDSSFITDDQDSDY